MGFDFRAELGKLTPKVAEGAKIYIFGAGEHWSKVCKQYKYTVGIDLNDYIDGFIDNDIEKQCRTLHGKPINKPEEITPENSIVLISTNFENCCEIGAQLNKQGFLQYNSYFTAEWLLAPLMNYGYTRVMQFKNKHKGQRCFIIGNGPSLRAEDLDRLKGEYTFATNKIFTIFNRTLWRPSYYFVGDPVVLKTLHKDINQKIQCPVFYAYNHIAEYNEFILNDNYFYCIDNNVSWLRSAPYDKPSFSIDPFSIQSGATVTYECIQFAVFMGFDEIYFIGVDNIFPLSARGNGEIIMRDTNWHFSSDYGRHVFAIALIDKVNNAYLSAREYCDSHGIKIYNATRGGKLEAFERVDFDSLF